MKYTIAVMLIVGTLYIVGCSTAYDGRGFEYKQERGVLSDADLDKLADEGWSVINVVRDDDDAVYLLRRVKR